MEKGEIKERCEPKKVEKVKVEKKRRCTSEKYKKQRRCQSKKIHMRKG